MISQVKVVLLSNQSKQQYEMQKSHWHRHYLTKYRARSPNKNKTQRHQKTSFFKFISTIDIRFCFTSAYTRCSVVVRATASSHLRRCDRPSLGARHLRRHIGCPSVNAPMIGYCFILVVNFRMNLTVYVLLFL